MRQQAHGRIERVRPAGWRRSVRRATSIAAIPEIQQRVLQSIRSDATFATSSVWVTTGAPLRDAARVRQLGEGEIEAASRVRAVEGVEQVFDQLIRRQRPNDRAGG